MPPERTVPPAAARHPPVAVHDLDERIVAALVAAITLVVFLPALDCGFVNVDDPQYVQHNPVVLGGLTASAFRRAWTEPVFHNWAPLTVLSLAADVSLFGPGPRGFHLTNILLHTATATVLFLALERMTGAVGRSAAATLLFAVHPLRVESVAWVAERKDVLSLLFIALALLAYEWHARQPSPRRMLAVAAAMLASLLAKATAVTLPVLVLILDVWPLGRAALPGLGVRAPEAAAPRHPQADWPMLVREKVPLAVLSAAFIGITLWSQQAAIQSEDRMPLVAVRIPNAVVALGAALADTVLPVALHPVHTHRGTAGVTGLELGLSLAAVVLLGGVAVRLRRAVPACPAGLAWFVVAFSPVLGIVAQQGFQARADRFSYLPHVGLFVAIVWTVAEGLARLRLPARAGPALVAAAAGGCIVVTVSQIATWKDSAALWTNVLACEPDHPVAHLGLGEEWFDRGQTDLAIAEFRRAIEIDETARAHDWLGLALARKGALAEAYAEHEAATRLDPENSEAHNNAGIALARMNRTAEALIRFEQAARLQPDDAEVQANIALARRILQQAPSPRQIPPP